MKNPIRKEELEQNPVSKEAQKLLAILDELDDFTADLRKKISTEIKNIDKSEK